MSIASLFRSVNRDTGQQNPERIIQPKDHADQDPVVGSQPGTNVPAESVEVDVEVETTKPAVEEPTVAARTDANSVVEPQAGQGVDEAEQAAKTAEQMEEQFDVEVLTTNNIVYDVID